MLPIDTIRAVFDYDAGTGVLRWRIRPHARSPKRPGDEAGSFDNEGYRRGTYLGVEFRAHRLIWAFITGAWPSDEIEIDHRDGNRANNRWLNLRLATSAENQQNIVHAKAGCASGLVGASWNSRAGRWQGAIGIDYRVKYLGLFDTAEAAHQAYLAAKANLHPFARSTEKQ